MIRHNSAKGMMFSFINSQLIVERRALGLLLFDGDIKLMAHFKKSIKLPKAS